MPIKHNISASFPILQKTINDHRLVYLDNAATTHSPIEVQQSFIEYSNHAHSNIHRGIHTLSERSTQRFEDVRSSVAKFIGAPKKEHIVFCKGATEAINLVAAAFLRSRISSGAEIIVTAMEHNSNFIPWQAIAKEFGVTIHLIPVAQNGELDYLAYEKLLSHKTCFVAVTHVSNVLGTVNDVKRITHMAKQYQAPVLVDGAQAVSHVPVDVQDIDCDFYVFSGHKMYAPTGIGVLYAKTQHLDVMQPYQYGGGAVLDVELDETMYLPAPYKFEPGTPNIHGVIGLGRAIEYINTIGLAEIMQHEQELTQYCITKLQNITGIKIIGHGTKRIGVISFELEGVHPHDIASLCDSKGVAIRAGHHCAVLLLKHLGYSSLNRLSFAIYNTREDVDILCASLQYVRELFQL